MIPICKARGLADGPDQGLPAEAERHRLVAALPAGSGALALRVAGWGRRPAVAPGPAAPLPRACRPSAI